MIAYYNEHNPKAAAWLRELIRRNLIAPGDVDERSILDVRPDEIAHYTQAHFFAGIGGWSYALRLAGWPDDRPVWTGSCPCQPFSSASRGRGKGEDSEKHLWPAWARIIASVAPRVVFGEQVAHAGGWFDGVCDDLEAMGYEVGACILPAVAVGFDHARARIYFVGNADGNRQPERALNVEVERMPTDRGIAPIVAGAHGIPARMGRMRGYGNAIVPEVARQFISAYMAGGF